MRYTTGDLVAWLTERNKKLLEESRDFLIAQEIEAFIGTKKTYGVLNEFKN